jgi:hypothetical protein
MGLFSSKTYYFVDSSTIPLVEKLPPNFFVSSVVRGVLNNIDTTFNMFKIYTTGPTATLKRYIRYGKNKYYYGLPTINTTFDFFDPDTLELVLESLEGMEVAISNVFCDELTDDDNALLYCYKNHGLNLLTGTITTTSTTWPYNVVTYRFSHTENNGSRAVFSRTVTESDWEGGTYTYTEYYYINNIPPNPGGIWYVALYSTDGGLTTKYFEYKTGSGVYPELDGGAGQIDQTPTPVAILRNQYRFIDDSSFPDEAYDTTKGLLDVMSLSINEFLDAFKGQDQISKIGDVSFVFGSRLRDTNNDVQRYLFEFFNSINTWNIDSGSGDNITNNTETFYFSLLNRGRGKNVFGNKYQIKEARYDYTICYKYITKTINTGVLGNVGTVTATYYIDNNDNATATRSEGDGDFTYSVPDPILNSYIILNKQVTTTTYESIKVAGLYSFADLPQTNGQIQTKFIYMKDSDQFLIPVIWDILSEEMPIKKQEAVIFRAMHFVAYSADQQKVSWFKNFLGSFIGKIIIIVILTWIMGPVGAAKGASWSTLGTAAFIKQVAISVLISIVIEKILLPVLGDNAFLFAIAALAVGYYGFEAFGYDLGYTGFADYLLNNVWAIVNFAGNVLNAMTYEVMMEGQDLLKEMEEFDKSVKEKQEDIQNAKDLLNVSLLNPAYLVTKKMDRYYKNSNNFYTNCLKTNLASDMKQNATTFKQVNIDPWATVPSYI